MRDFIFKITYRAVAVMLSLALLISFALVSCGTDNNGSDANSITFTDALGREVTVKRNAERVAALLGSFADVWTLAGGKLCAAAEDAWEDFGLDLEGAVNLGGAHSPSLELLLSSSPDFVIASASTASNVEMKDVLTSLGITVAYFEVNCFDDYLEMLDVTTDITGRKDLYEQNGLALNAQIEKIKEDYKNKNLPESDKKILLLRASSTAVKPKGSSGTILGEMLADMGCINIADQSSSILENLSIEAIITANPRHIFIVTMGSDTEAAKASVLNMISENPAWQALSAVKENRLHIMDKKLFNLKPNAKFAQAYGKLYEILIK